MIVPKEQDGRRSPRTTSSRPCSTRAPRRSTTSARPSRCVSEATDLVAVRTALQDAGIDYDSAEASFVPTMQVAARRGRRRARCSASIDALEDLDDVQNVYANFDVPDEVMAELEAADLTSGRGAALTA